MFDHRNQQFSTILVAATIMLSALVAVLAQGVLHEDSAHNSLLVIVYSVSNSLSMSFLFMCDIFCMGVLWRASRFMKNRSRSHYGFLDKAIKKTKEMVRSIRGVKEENSINDPLQYQDQNNGHARNHYGSTNYDEGHQRRGSGQYRESPPKSPHKKNCKRRIISHMQDRAVSKEFTSHEEEIHAYLEERESIIDKSAYIVSADSGRNIDNKSFEKFWQESCSIYANAAVFMFYAGCGALIFANGTFVSSTFLFRYRCVSGGVITFVIIIFTLPVALILLIYMRYIEDVVVDFEDDEDDIGNDGFRTWRCRIKRPFKNLVVSFWSPSQLYRHFFKSKNSYTEIIDESISTDVCEEMSNTSPYNADDDTSEIFHNSNHNYSEPDDHNFSAVVLVNINSQSSMSE